MAPPTTKRRRGDESERRPKKKIRIKKQKRYHSSSEDEDDEDENVAHDAPAKSVVAKQRASSKAPKSILKQKPAVAQELEVDSDDEDGLDGVEINTALNMAPQSEDEDEELVEGNEEGVQIAEGLQQAEDSSASDDEEDDDEFDLDEDDDPTSSAATKSNKTKKRNDPTAFATSISKILDTKLTTSKRADPVLSRSKSAAEANKSITDTRLENQAKAAIRAEKKASLEKGRVKDVLGLETAEVDTGAILEEEKRLKKTAQRGVVKLFNAVRAAQVKAEQGLREARAQGVVGMKQREDRVNEMSKQGFLDLISSGGGKKTGALVT